MVCKVFSSLVMVMVVSCAYADETTPSVEELETRLAPAVKRFEDLSALQNDKVVADQVAQKAQVQAKAKADDEKLKQALLAAQGDVKKKTAIFGKALAVDGIKAAVTSLAREVVLAAPRNGTIAVLKAFDKPCVQQFTQGRQAAAVAAFLGSITGAMKAENAPEIRAAVEQYCAENGGTPAGGWAAKILYWKTGADPLQTVQSSDLAKPLRDNGATRYVDALLADGKGAVSVGKLVEAVAVVPEEYQGSVKAMILADTRSVPAITDKDAYLAFIADHPKQADLKFAFFLKNKSAPDVKALILERVTPTLPTYNKDLGAANNQRLLSAADILELDTAAQGQAANLVPAIVLRRTTYGDPIRMTAIPAQAYADECKFVLRATDGRVTRESVRAVVDHIVDGKGELAIPVSDTTKAFGAKLPAKTFPALMYQGEFAAAAQLAYAQINESKSDTDYLQAVARLRQAVQCLDRCYNGRSLELVKWLNGDLDACPVPELVK